LSNFLFLAFLDLGSESLAGSVHFNVLGVLAAVRDFFQLERELVPTVLAFQVFNFLLLSFFSSFCFFVPSTHFIIPIAQWKAVLAITL
jgi:hypothetical protein